jgi:N-acetylmuramoyl-L-alanine amidase
VLRAGDHGDAVRDLQTRLAELGLGSAPDDFGTFGDGTDAAVRAFQARRGLHVDGLCGRQTWAALVEAGYRPGDRLLYYSSPFLRGDDVADLQRRLGALGFDAGRVDGIFGPDTQRALLDFQRNAGITPDAVCGVVTLAALARLSGRTPPDPVAGVREREHLRRSAPTLAGRRLVVGDLGGLAALVRAVNRSLTGTGAMVIGLAHPDASAQAAQANGIGADAYLGVASRGQGCRTAFYATEGFESAGGRRLAECIQDRIPDVLGAARRPAEGMAVPILRETRMPAVVCELGPPSTVVERGAALAAAFAVALECWVHALAEV